MRSGNLIEAIGNTPLVELPTFSPTPSIRIYAKLEGNNPTGSVKDRIARSMVQAALSDGILSRDKILLEPTSGNTGISLAMVTHRLGYRFTAVMPDNVSVERSQLLSAYGAEIVYSPGDGGSNGSITLAQEMTAADERYVMLYQYGNAANPQAHYETTAPEILRDLPEVTHFVAGLGTGGTLMGVGRRLKEFNPAIEVIAAAPEIDDRIQGLRSLEEGFVPPILDLSLLDGRIMVSGEESFQKTAEVLHKEGVFAGVSSGAVLAAAQRVAARVSDAHIVCLFADGGWKYLSTGLWTDEDPAGLREKVQGKVWW
ncbi:MAG: pyridoxal-phosphate dependent enzyme [Chloroflexi bacterium]|nr:pyridoxal-phosphate dependent enzyme [Chloroflexota bacterium]